MRVGVVQAKSGANRFVLGFLAEIFLEIWKINLLFFVNLGFDCRCGGLYCWEHRYSDKHNCKFDYKELGQDQIRKNNPIVVGEKIQKI